MFISCEISRNLLQSPRKGVLLMMKYSATNDLISLRSIPTFRLRIPSGETVDSVQHFAYVLDCISMLFQRHIPQIGSSELTIINNPDAPNPVCYKGKCEILLATLPSSWSQIAYQYAHELCHHAIPDTVAQNLRWFEESICEMASLFFLFEIGELWHLQKEELYTSSGEPYASSFISYAKKAAQRGLPFDLKDERHLQSLESNCYDRPRNNYVATRLLPIFVEYPQLWETVPLLAQIHQPTLTKALDAWILESPPSARPGLQQIRNLF